MGTKGVENDVTRAILYGEPLSPYNTNLSADIDELTPDRLRELKSRSEKVKPVVKKNNEAQPKGLLSTKKIKIRS